MKRIIGGKIYDTATAEAVAIRPKVMLEDCIILYKTKKGNFFSFTETGALGDRGKIRPLTKDQAIELYENLELDGDYEYIFGITPEEA